MNTQAVGIAPYDLAAGLDFLKQLAKENNLTFLSMNLFLNQGTTMPLFSPYLLTQAGEVRVALLGLTGDLPYKQQDKEFHTLPWQETLPKTLREVEEKTDMIILLSSASRKTNEAIARKFDNIHIILQSGQGGTNLPPININNTLLCQTATRGKHLGLMEISWNETKTWGKSTPDQLKKEQNRLDRINWQIGRIQKRNPEQSLANNAKYQRLLHNKAQSKQAIQLLKEQKKSNRQTQPPCSYKNSFIALKDSLPEDMTIKAVVDQTRREVNQINRKTQLRRTERLKGEEQTTSNTAFPEALQKLAGSQACRKCHPEQVEFYLSTDHAKAWQTLVSKDQQYNLDCLLCHVTLPTYNSKQVQEKHLLKNLPIELRGVGCEACHGPARRHVQQPKNIRPAKPAQAVCLQCHSKEHDDNFIFSEKNREIRCPAGKK